MPYNPYQYKRLFTEDQYQLLESYEKKRYGLMICNICKINQQIWFIKQDDGMYALTTNCIGNDLGGWHGISGLCGLPGISGIQKHTEEDLEIARIHNEKVLNPQCIPDFEVIIKKVIEDRPIRGKFCGLPSCDVDRPHIH